MMLRMHIYYLNSYLVGFGLPPTPPSSSPSDDSEGNQSPEHHTSNAPLSPSSNSSQSQSQQQMETQMFQQQAAKISSNSRRASGLQQNSQLNANASRGYNGSSSRQPIHTNLISTQPVILSY